MKAAIGILAVVALAVLSGCVGHDAELTPRPVQPSPTGLAKNEPPPYQPNVWLLEAPHVSATRVSAGSEPVILADRTGGRIWIGDTTGAYYSDDNGTVWRGMGGYTLNTGFAFIDGVALAQDESGRVYGAYLHDNRVDVVRSDSGTSWGQPTYAAGVSGTADRPWIAASGEEVVLFYFDAPLVATGFFEHCARSTDAGRTFVDRDPLALPPTGGSAFFAGDGAFYFSSNDGSLYGFDATCTSAPRAVRMFQTLGVNNMIQGAADGADLYMVAATSGGAMTLAGAHASGGGTKTLRLSPPDLPTNTFGALSARDGRVAIAWYGSETDGDPSATGFGGAFNVYVAVVEGFWTEAPTVRFTRLTSDPNHVGTICMGGITCTASRELLDYFGVALDAWGGVHVAYVDSEGGSGVHYGHLEPGFGTVAAPPTTGPSDGLAPLIFSETRGLQLKVDATASEDQQGQPLSYLWSWGDGSSTTPGERWIHSYDKAGIYRVTLQVAASDGRSASTSRDISVDAEGANAKPEPKFSASATAIRPGEAVRFSDQSHDPDGVLIGRSWDFGDGNKASSSAPTHRFDVAGTFRVRLTVQDDWWANATAGIDIVVAGEAVTGSTGPVTIESENPPSTDGQFVPAIPVAALAAALVVASLRRRRA